MLYIYIESIFHYAEAKRPKVQICVCPSPQKKKEARGNFSQGKEHCQRTLSSSLEKNQRISKPI